MRAKPDAGTRRAGRRESRTSTASGRTGFWRFDRDYFASIAHELDAVSRLVMIELVNDAAVADEPFRFEDRSEIRLGRGMAVLSCEGIAERINSNASTVWRRLCDLEAAGLIRREGKEWLKRGKGQRPTVVTITDYERFGFERPWSGNAREIMPDRIEGKSHQGGNQSTEIPVLLSITNPKNHREDVSRVDIGSFDRELASIKTDGDILDFYRRHARSDCDAELSLARIGSWIERHGLHVVASTTAAFIADHDGTMSAQWFFSEWVFPAYVGSHVGNPLALSVGETSGGPR